MPEVYARTLDLSVPAATDLQAALLSALKEWVGSRWTRQEEWFVPDAPRRLATDDGSIFRWEPFQQGDQALFEFTWRHAHAGDASITWATQVSLVRVGARVGMSIRVWNTGPAPGTPGFLPTTRPRLLASLPARFESRFLGVRLSLTPRTLERRDVSTFVRYELLDSTRRVPLLVITPRQDGSYVVDPLQITEEFLSLAEPIVIADPKITFDFTRELGDRAISCFNGAARLYMPGFSKKDDPFRHPLLLPRRLGDAELRLRYAESLARMSVEDTRPIEDIPRLRDLRAVAYDAREAQVARAFVEAQRRGAEAAEWQALADEYARENDRLRAEVARLQEDNEELDHAVRTLRYRLSQVPRTETDVAVGAPAFAPSSMLEAVELAQAAYDEELRILDSAVTAAADSPYADPAEVFRALQVLAELARRLRQGPLGTNLKDWFLAEGRGLQYRSGISPNSSAAIRAQHVFVDGEERFVCEEHLRFGTAYDPVRCARIYFTSKLDGQGRIVVGHAGRHLDTPKTN
jgi:hypothetical protein